jgi:hypothetical protein
LQITPNFRKTEISLLSILLHLFFFSFMFINYQVAYVPYTIDIHTNIEWLLILTIHDVILADF